MRVKPRRLVIALASIVAFSDPANLSAQTPLPLGSWNLFEWFLGAGPVDGSGFLLNAVERTRIRVTDDGVTGDAFDVFLNGSFRAATPSVPGGVLTGAFDGDAAWAAPGLSRTEFFVDPGQYTITLTLREAGSGFEFGEGCLRADAAPLASVVPEPASLGLVAAGLVVIGLVRRRTAHLRVVRHAPEGGAAKS